MVKNKQRDMLFLLLHGAREITFPSSDARSRGSLVTETVMMHNKSYAKNGNTIETHLKIIIASKHILRRKNKGEEIILQSILESPALICQRTAEILNNRSYLKSQCLETALLVRCGVSFRGRN